MHKLISKITTYTFECGKCGKNFEDKGFDEVNQSLAPEPLDIQDCPHCGTEDEVDCE